jgi:putative DNA primase/helicase
MQTSDAASTTNLAAISAWWRRWPDANLAIATGQPVVIDVDGTAGENALEYLQREHAELPPTRRARTAHGMHLYFDAGAQQIRCSAGRLGPGLDVRGHGGYVVSPPSLHVRGHRYRWTTTEPAAQLPTWLAELLIPPAPTASIADATEPTAIGASRGARYAQAALAHELERIATAQPGIRNNTLNRSAFRLGQLAGAGLIPADDLLEPLRTAAQRAGLTDAEATATIASGLRAGQQHPPRPARRTTPP